MAERRAGLLRLPQGHDPGQRSGAAAAAGVRRAESIGTIRPFVGLLPNPLRAWRPERLGEAHLRLALLNMQVTDFAAEWLQGMRDVERPLILDVLTDLWMGGLGVVNEAPPAVSPP